MKQVDVEHPFRCSLRWRKESPAPFLYNVNMSAPITAKTLVHEVLHSYPQVAPVFIRHQMDCLGCWLQRFCTLEDAAVAYGLSTNTLLEEIQQAIPLSGGE